MSTRAQLDVLDMLQPLARDVRAKELEADADVDNVHLIEAAADDVRQQRSADRDADVEILQRECLEQVLLPAVHRELVAGAVADADNARHVAPVDAEVAQRHGPGGGDVNNNLVGPSLPDQVGGQLAIFEAPALPAQRQPLGEIARAAALDAGPRLAQAGQRDAQRARVDAGRVVAHDPDLDRRAQLDRAERQHHLQRVDEPERALLGRGGGRAAACVCVHIHEMCVCGWWW